MFFTVESFPSAKWAIPRQLFASEEHASERGGYTSDSDCKIVLTSVSAEGGTSSFKFLVHGKFTTSDVAWLFSFRFVPYVHTVV